MKTTASWYESTIETATACGGKTTHVCGLHERVGLGQVAAARSNLSRFGITSVRIDAFDDDGNVIGSWVAA